MKTTKSLLLIFSLMILLSCKTARERKAAQNDSELPMAELVDDLEPFTNSADCSIMKVGVEGNIMTINVEYSGGCEKHEFRLLGSTYIQKSLPPRRGITLWHDNKGDSCRGIVDEELKFDISAFAYEGGEIILDLTGWATPISYTQVK